jgi:hypothetical protein
MSKFAPAWALKTVEKFDNPKSFWRFANIFFFSRVRDLFLSLAPLVLVQLSPPPGGVEHAASGYFRNCVAKHRQSSLLLSPTLSIIPPPPPANPNLSRKIIWNFEIITNPLNTLLRKYYYTLYFPQYISAYIKI